MTTEQSNLGDDIGKQSGSLRTLTKSAILLASILLSVTPLIASASTRYLVSNTDTFLDKIESSYGEIINIAALLHDYDKKMIAAVIVVESEGNEVALSNKGARGLMQLMPLTAKSMGATDPRDPFQNILAGTKYLKQLEGIYGFNSPQDALVAYNMGPSRAKRWLSQYDSRDYGYVQKVMYVYQVLERREIAERNIALIRKAEIKDDSMMHIASKALRPFLLKPRNVTLTELPFTLALSRKDSLVTTD